MLTKCAVITAYTGVVMLEGKDIGYLYHYLEGFAGRPVFSHEMPSIAEMYRDKIKEDFIAICKCAADSAHLIPAPGNSKALPTCSACGAEILQIFTAYCGNCGANLDEEVALDAAD